MPTRKGTSFAWTTVPGFGAITAIRAPVSALIITGDFAGLAGTAVLPFPDEATAGREQRRVRQRQGEIAPGARGSLLRSRPHTLHGAAAQMSRPLTL